jgi:hypothetical protein
MTQHVIVWDLETVPDLAAVARANGLNDSDEAAARSVVGDKFAKHLFQSGLSGSWAEADIAASALRF